MSQSMNPWSPYYCKRAPLFDYHASACMGEKNTHGLSRPGSFHKIHLAEQISVATRTKQVTRAPRYPMPSVFDAKWWNVAMAWCASQCEHVANVLDT